MLARTQPNATFQERRQVSRRTLNRVAHYQMEGGLPRSCVITDISDGGARLHCESAMPDRFVLSVYFEDGEMRRDCRVVWRLGCECGVAFTHLRRS